MSALGSAYLFCRWTDIGEHNDIDHDSVDEEFGGNLEVGALVMSFGFQQCGSSSPPWAKVT